MKIKKNLLNIKNPNTNEWEEILAIQGEKGDKGDTGLQGIQGEKGDKGDKGEDGLTTAIKVNGETYTQENGLITLPNISSSKVAYGTCSTGASVSEKEVVVEDTNWKLEVGVIVVVKPSVSNKASNVKINVNNTGAYPIWYSTSEYTSTSTTVTGSANLCVTYMFNGTHWVWISRGNYPSSASNASLGHGYGICSTAEATLAKACTISNYTLATGGSVSIKFTNAVPANSTLNIRTRGAKKIFYKGSAITDGIIKAGDTATFVYDGTQYQLISIDRDEAVTKTSQLTNDSDFISNPNLVTPQMFGAKADGVTDDSQAILDAISALPKDGGTLYFPPGTYIHGDGITTGYSYQLDTSFPEGHACYPAPLMQNKGVDDKIGRKIRMDFDGYTNLTIKGDGAILQSHDNNGECSNNGFFVFKNCENLIIEGLTIDGRRHQRGIHFSDYSPGGYDLIRTNIHIYRCKKVIVRNVISKGAQMDGMALASGTPDNHSEDILIEKCKFLDNHRQGISIEGVTNATVRDTECSYNGTGDGILPKSGIDVEAYGKVSDAESYSFNNNVLIDHCYFVGNGYSNIVVNNNSFNTVVQYCTFKDAWVSAQHNGDGKLLYCKLINCGLSNGYRYIAHNEIIYNKGGYVMRSTDVSENTISTIEHNTFDLSGSTSDYNAIRLSGKETFRYNYIKNASSNVIAHYPLFFQCTDFYGNTMELTEAPTNTSTFIQPKSADSKYRDNKVIGNYIASTLSFDECYKTDETITRTYNSRIVGYNKILKLLDYTGLIKLTARYLEQVEEVLICRSAGNYCHHYVFRRNSNLENKDLLTVYRDGSRNYYIKPTWTNTSITIDCAYCYGGTEVNRLEEVDWLTTSSVAESSLTKISSVNTPTFTSSLKSNYDNAYTHSQSTHAPSNAQKNSDITKAEIEAKLTGNITTHTHDGIGDFVQNDWGAENVGMVLMVGSDGRIALYDLSDFNPNAQFFKVTQNLTNVSSDFSKAEAKENLPLTITLVTTNGKKMGTVTVIMNGDDVTSAVYNDSTGKVVISALNGDLIINARAMLYTNLADPTDSEWITGKRMDNYGKQITGIGIISNKIYCKAGDTIRIKGLIANGVLGGSTSAHVVVDIYTSDGSRYYVQCVETVNGNGFFKDNTYVEDKSTAYLEFTFKTGLNIGYIKVSGDVVGGVVDNTGVTAGTMGDINQVIITVNEEIAE